MEYKKIPLEEQLQNITDGFHIHPEYSACAILAWGEIPIAAYLGGDTEKGKQRRMKLMHLLHIPPEKEMEMTYRDAAKHINCWKQGKMYGYRVEKAMRLLAEPLADGYEIWKERRKNAENST